MNTRLLLTLALVLGLALGAPLMGTALADADDAPGAGNWEHLNEMRAIMHYAVMQAEPLTDGVRVSVTSGDERLVEAIRHEFVEERHDLGEFYPGTAVAAAEIDGGAALTFTAQDEATVQRLQGYGTGLVYNMLRANMHTAMHGEGAWGRGPGWGHMGRMGGGMGWGHMRGGYGGMGYGPGWGYGPQGEAPLGSR